MSRQQTLSPTVVNALSVAGIDPSGGAGLIADIKTFSALGAYGCGVVTAVTAQNTCAVTGVHPVPGPFLTLQLDTLFSDVRVDAVKIGMLANAEIVGRVAAAIRASRPPFVVLDPVMVAKSGDRLLAPDAVDALRAELLPLATIVTPNLPEAGDLIGRVVSDDPEDMRAAAEEIAALGATNVLVKGGHGERSRLTDVLFDGRLTSELHSDRVETRNTHGTGCTFSAAIAALAPARPTMRAAVEDAHAYVAGAIRHADALSVGRGHGPLHHFFSLWPQVPSRPPPTDQELSR
ncbi:MAG: bifunctional hydroxymethylpyrimidine kinase/phosphomethylpyrimidine kinase [Betaproteobacteria bacterium]|nr:bifunctional hydroxymethylpyrimidine kinase/phosphomethylpyrimidine kinase [Betaproteobacteria bacterium]